MPINRSLILPCFRPWIEIVVSLVAVLFFVIVSLRWLVVKNIVSALPRQIPHSRPRQSTPRHFLNLITIPGSSKRLPFIISSHVRPSRRGQGASLLKAICSALRIPPLIRPAWRRAIASSVSAGICSDTIKTEYPSRQCHHRRQSQGLDRRAGLRLRVGSMRCWCIEALVCFLLSSQPFSIPALRK